MIRTGRSCRIAINEAFADFFPQEKFREYRDFLSPAGSYIKDKSNVGVAELNLGDNNHKLKFLFKEYRLNRADLRTWRSAICAREFYSLKHCNDFGVPAVTPAVYGMQRSLIKTVKSCFLITEMVEDAQNLRQLMHENRKWLCGKDPELEKIFFELGRKFRRLHKHRFFVYNSHTRNILVRKEGPGREAGPQIILLDIPNARFKKGRRTASRARDTDLGRLLKRPVFYGHPGLTDSFYKGYLPDPLGLEEPELRQRVIRAAAVQDNRTLPARCKHVVEKGLKKFLKACAAKIKKLHSLLLKKALARIIL